MNKFLKNKVFTLKSGCQNIYHKFDGKNLMIMSLAFHSDTQWRKDCGIDKCICTDPECCLLRNPCYRNEAKYLTDKKFKEYLEMDKQALADSDNTL